MCVYPKRAKIDVILCIAPYTFIVYGYNFSVCVSLLHVAVWAQVARSAVSERLLVRIQVG
jgi:hypothetical protein